MRKRTVGTAIFIIFTLFLTVLPLWQLADWKETKSEKGRIILLLYQVSTFQMESMGSVLTNAGNVKETEQLTALRQAAYSAGYTHERLVEAVGTGELVKLESVEALQEYILRLQVGANRQLKPDEVEALLQAAAIYKKLFEDYSKLISLDGEAVKSQSTKVTKEDREIAELLKKRLK